MKQLLNTDLLTWCKCYAVFYMELFIEDILEIVAFQSSVILLLSKAIT